MQNDRFKQIVYINDIYINTITPGMWYMSSAVCKKQSESTFCFSNVTN